MLLVFQCMSCLQHIGYKLPEAVSCFDKILFVDNNQTFSVSILNTK